MAKGDVAGLKNSGEARAPSLSGGSLVYIMDKMTETLLFAKHPEGAEGAKKT